MQSLQLKARQFFNPATVRDDLTAGLVLGIESVPDGLAQGFLASINLNPDGKYPNASGDFAGQGVANLASGLFQGMPVGGSFSATSLVVNAGAKSRLANIVAGIVMAVVIVISGKAVGSMAMPAMAGLLIVVGFRTLKPDRVEMVWKTGPVQQVVMAITFLACLVIPLQYAVLMGVALSLVLFVVQRSNKVTVKAWTWTPGELMVEQDAPQVVPANEITLLVPYGSLFFATAPLIEAQLPAVTEESRHAVVILNLLKQEDLGSTFLQVLDRYAADLRQREGKLMLAAVSPAAKAQLDQTGLMVRIGRENVFTSTERIGEAVLEAWYAADRWLGRQTPYQDNYFLPQQPDREEPGDQE